MFCFFVVLSEDVALITAKIDSMSDTWNILSSAFDFDPDPVHILNAVNPKSRLIGVLSIVIIIASPKHHILLVDVDEVCYLFCRFYVSDDLLDPHIRFCAHWTIQKSQLIEVIKQQIGHAFLVCDHPLSSEQVQIISL